jgi:hypothetical protein
MFGWLKRLFKKSKTIQPDPIQMGHVEEHKEIVKIEDLTRKRELTKDGYKFLEQRGDLLEIWVKRTNRN